MLAFADDIVSLVFSWYGLITRYHWEGCCSSAFNTDKTVCVVANRYDRRTIASFSLSLSWSWRIASL